MGNACYYSFDKILSSHLLSKKLKVNTYITIILPVVLYGCETWSLTLREEHRLRVFKNKVFRKLFGARNLNLLFFYCLVIALQVLILSSCCVWFMVRFCLTSEEIFEDSSRVKCSLRCYRVYVDSR